MAADTPLLGRVATTLAVLLLLCSVAGLGVGMLGDNTFRAGDSVVIDAPVDAIHPFVASPRQHSAWMGWDDDADPSLARSYDGPESGVGAISRFRGELMGAGSLRIDESDEQRGVRWTQQLPNRVVSHGEVRYEALGPERTRVIWHEQGTIPRPHGPFFVRLVARSMQPYVQRSLAFLAAAAEGRPPPRASQAPPTGDAARAQ